MNASGQDLQIGLWAGDEMHAVTITVSNGIYDIYADGAVISALPQQGSIRLQRSGSVIKANYAGKTITAKKIILKAAIRNAEISITPENPSRKKRLLQDDLYFAIKGNGFTCVNELNIEKYVAGVVEAETGKDEIYEFYKVQAIIARTYALANKNKHFGTGFHLCDEVHCQVFHGKSRWNDSIAFATYATKGQVLVDNEARLIQAAFHSNCGGHTVHSETVWSRPLEYLVGVKDTFCLSASQSHWEREINAAEWRSYLQKTFGYNMSDSLSAHRAMHYYPDFKKKYMMNPEMAINLNKIRTDWKLKSTFFVVHEEGDQVKLTGRGFGHGVGLCQQGAMNMCRHGHSCSQVLHHYYTGVHLMHTDDLGLFRD